MDEYNITILTDNENYAFIESLSPSKYVVTAVNLLLGLSGVGAFLFLLWGGLQWITAGSDKDAVEKARKKMVNALIGLTIVFSAYVILFVIRILFNVDIIGFSISNLGT